MLFGNMGRAVMAGKMSIVWAKFQSVLYSLSCVAGPGEMISFFFAFLFFFLCFSLFLSFFLMLKENHFKDFP